MASIHIDDREKDKLTGVGRHNKGRESIINYFEPYIDKYCAQGLPMVAEVRRIVVGDYAIMLHNTDRAKLVMIIERKTWKDLSASFDGRLEGQINSMKKLRETEGCALLFIVEGPAVFNKKDAMCGGKPYSSLYAKLRHCLIRDGIPWIHTKNQMHTAETICDFAADYMRLVDRGDIEVDFKSGGEDGELPEELTKRKESPDDVIVCKMWCGISGVREHTSSALRKNYKLYQLMAGEIPVEDIAELRYADGMRVGERRAKGIFKAAQTYDSQIRAFTAIPGVSKAGATRMIAQSDQGLLGIYLMNVKEIAVLQKTDKTKVGKVVAERIRKFMDLA